MIHVGLHLRHEATTRNAANFMDSFARSSFNRFYYAAFLHVRGTLQDLTLWPATMGHADLPLYIRGEVLKGSRKGLKEAQRTGLISIGEYNRLKALLESATNEIHSVLTEGYAIRVLADYRPEQSIQGTGSAFTLGGCPVVTAVGWFDRVRDACSDLAEVRSAIGA